MPVDKKSALLAPESKNLVVFASNNPVADSNNSELSNSKAPSNNTTLFFVPPNVGCSAWLVMALKFKTPLTLEIIAVAFELKFPNLSTAFIRYVPFLDGTDIEVAGLDIFSTNATEFCQSAVPSNSSENLRL